MSSQKRISISKMIAVGILILISLYAFSLFYLTSDQRYFKNQFNEFVATGKNEIAIRDLTDFPWDSVCHLGAYDDFWQEKGRVGKYPIKDGVEIPYFTHKGRWGFAFINNGQVVKAFEVKIGAYIYPKAFCTDNISAYFEKGTDRDYEFYNFTNIKN